MNIFAVLDLWIDYRLADLDHATKDHPENSPFHDARRRELTNLREFLHELRKP